MLTPSHLHDYQKRAVNHQCVHPNSMLWLDPGLGKTAITLTTVEYLQRVGWLGSVLIVAPLRVCRLVWRQEAAKWTHTKGLTFGMVMGTPDQRTRALMRPANIYLTNYENMMWLAKTIMTYYVKKGKSVPFNGLVLDEVSKCKNSTTNRVHSWFDARRNENLLDHFIWTSGLTGTPAANGFKDLHGQYLMIDKGVRLGTSKTAFMTRWYKKDDQRRKDIPYKDTEDSIKGLIADITMEMSAADYIKLPDMITNDVMVELPQELRAKYDQLEKDFFIRLDSGSEVESFNQASLTNRLLQFSNGAMYPVAGMPLWEPIHDAKLDALEEIIDEANGQPVLCFYAYRSDAERIMKKFRDLDPINLSECKSESAMQSAMFRWTTGDCQLMICHPGSAGHGVDGLQKTGSIIVWFGLNWSLELTLQANARLHRQGQGKPVVCHRIMCKDTMDEAQALALNEKADTQTSLRKAVKEYRERREKQ